MLDVTFSGANGLRAVTFTLPVTPVSGREFGSGAHIQTGTTTFDSGNCTIDSVNGGVVRPSGNTNYGNGTGKQIAVCTFYEVP
jgi:hypothetical protein